MPGGNIGVDMSVIVSTAQNVRGDNQTMKGKLIAISDGVNALNSSWQSEAASQLTSISSKMSSEFVELEKRVEEFARFLDQVAANYEKTEGAATETTQAISGMFD